MRRVQADSQLLPDPPLYFPLRHGRYDVAPGLSRFGRDLGGGAADTKVFQFDKTFPRFREAKLFALSARSDCVVSRHFGTEVARTIAKFLVDRLVAEHSDLFSRAAGGSAPLLQCHLTGGTVPLEVDTHEEGVLVKLGHQIQEDFAIVTRSADSEWLSFAHVCLPNGWAPAEKIGRSFAQIHEPVAGMAEMNRRGREFAELMIRATEGLVRFAWGITFDEALDHHPTCPQTPFDPGNPQAFLRVERQTIWGFPDVGAALFTIRTYTYDIEPLRRDPAICEPLRSALLTMPAGSVRYKGLERCWNDLIAWIDGRAR
jgi:hypothetical protein